MGFFNKDEGLLTHFTVWLAAGAYFVSMPFVSLYNVVFCAVDDARNKRHLKELQEASEKRTEEWLRQEDQDIEEWESIADRIDRSEFVNPPPE